MVAFDLGMCDVRSRKYLPLNINSTMALAALAEKDLENKSELHMLLYALLLDFSVINHVNKRLKRTPSLLPALVSTPFSTHPPYVWTATQYMPQSIR